MEQIPLVRVREVFAHRRPGTFAEREITSAVLVPFTHEEEATIVFTRRAADLQRFPGEMSFPGGRREAADASLETTALREAEEEVGVRATHVEFVGRLDDRVAYGGHRIRPFVAVLRAEARLVANPREVDRLFLLPLHRFLDPETYEARALAQPRGAVERVVHYFHLEEATVWGMTGRMVAELLEFVAAWRPPKEPIVVASPEDFTRGLDRTA